MAKSPKKLNIRTYHVGFGDCFLLSFEYGADNEKHILIDFGSTGLPEGTPKTRMMDIAKDIKSRSGGKLTAVIATHRHKDHISGFETKTGGKGTGDVIKSLKPELVIQPWTEDPDLAPDAAGPAGQKLGIGTRGFVAGLRSMQDVALQAIQQTKRTRYFGADLRQQLHFLGESNINNPSAVKNLMTMGKKTNYVYHGKDSGLKALLPGVTVDVLGPPTVKQTATIKKQRSKDPDEFWHFWRYQAAAMVLTAPEGKDPSVLFPHYVRARGPRFPVDVRWLIYRTRKSRGDQLLQIVRMLDKAMNNTSVILLFRIGKESLLFPGDAQIENWQYALSREPNQKLLSAVNVYKVGHHGSLNATPKSLWKLFKNKSTNAQSTKRLKSLMSTMEHKHGSEASHTEVPRATLVSALKSQSELFSTQSLKSAAFFQDTSIEF
ncbi:MAG: hypothetical protein ACM3IH_01850 [Sphingobacteriales bacterium]|jgi:hypothetical protein